MAAHAVRAALADAGLAWRDVQFAYGGSEDGGNADTMVSESDRPGSVREREERCATGGSSLVSACDRAAFGRIRGRARGRLRQAPARRVRERPGRLVAARVVRRGRPDGDDAVLRDEAPALHARPRHPPSTARAGCGKGVRNGAIDAARVATAPIPSEEILGAQMLAHPLTQYMLCSPGEGAVALVVCRRDTRAGFRTPTCVASLGRVRTRRAGTFEVFSPSLPLEIAASPTRGRRGRGVRGVPASARRRSTSSRCQDTESGAELIHLAECGLVRARRASSPSCTRAAPRASTASLPVNTDGGCLANGEPVGASGLRQVYEVVTQFAARRASARFRGSRRWASTQVYGAPGVSACTVVSR